jgi:hypothetical protein
MPTPSLDRVSRERMGRVTRVYGGRPVVSREICLPLGQGYEESSRVRRAEISHNTWGVRVVDKVHPLAQLIASQVGAMRPRPLARHGDVPATDQPHIGDRVVRGATWPGSHHRRAGTGAAGDAVEACGLQGVGQGHRRQDRGQPPRQPRRARPRAGRGGGRWGQNACIPFRFTRASRNADGPAAEPAREAASPV